MYSFRSCVFQPMNNSKHNTRQRCVPESVIPEPANQHETNTMNEIRNPAFNSYEIRVTAGLVIMNVDMNRNTQYSIF